MTVEEIVAAVNASIVPGKCPFRAGSSAAAYWHFQGCGPGGAREVAWAGYREACKKEGKRDPGPLRWNILGERVEVDSFD